MSGLLLSLLLAQATPPPLVNVEGQSTPVPAPAVVVTPSALDAGLVSPTTPPVFPSDLPLEARVVEATEKPKPPAEPERTGALHFSPLSIFSTHLSFELEKAITPSMTLFAAIGGSLLLQVGFDAGMRFYVSDKALSGAFLSVQGSVFYFSPSGTALVGPGAMFGYAFRPKDTLIITVGAGVQAWYQPTTDSGVRVLGVVPNLDVILLPGFQRPGTGKWGPQPMIRFTVGPTF